MHSILLILRHSTLVIPLLVYVFIFLSWYFYRATLRLPEMWDEALFKPLIWITPVVIISFWKKLSWFPTNSSLPILRYIFISLFVGLGLALLQIVSNVLKSNSLQILSFQITNNFVFVILAPIGTALSEEIVFRGFILQWIAKKFNPLKANIVTSVLFSLIHIPIFIFVNHLSGIDLMVALYIILVSSIIFGLLFLWKKDLKMSIIAHYTNNLLLSIFRF